MRRRLRAWLAGWGRALHFRGQARALPAAAPPPAPALPADDLLDRYARGAIGAQATVDIFKGVWSSELPAHLGVSSGSAQLFDDARLHWLFAQLGNIRGMRVLELGPLEGGHSYMLQQAGARHVLAIDACAMSYLKCLVVRDLCQLDRVDFRYGDFMTFLAEDGAAFDLVVASGVLYHQRDPVACIQRLAARSDRVFLWTHYYTEDLHSDYLRADMFVPAPRGAQAVADAFACEWFRLNYDTYLPGVKYRGGVDDHAHWMRRDDILACLRHFGLSDITIAFDQTVHPFGANMALLAQRPGVPSGAAPDSRSDAQERAYAQRLRAISGPEPWCVDTLRIQNGQLQVSGWAIPMAGTLGRMGFRVNGQDVAQLQCGLRRDDVGRYYGHYPAAHRSGFAFTHALGAAPTAPIALQYLDLDSGISVGIHDLYVRPQDFAADTPLPPLALIQRTHTGNGVDQYLVEGYSLYCALKRALQGLAAQALAGAGQVLDFGCGPGRLARYLVDEPGVQVLGVDVDPACVDWCRAHLGTRARFECGPLQPPLALADASVDMVWALYVMQHLRQEDGLRWLADWVRVCRPGGLVLVSIASELALSRAGLSAAHFDRVQGQEFLDLSRNPDLDGVVEEPDYYRNVFHAHAYVRRVWPPLGLEILGIVAGCLGNHHDLVVMRRLPGPLLRS